MNKEVGCTLLIKDDFNNVLVLNKKVGEKKVMKSVLIEL